jgi:hypothetical protein
MRLEILPDGIGGQPLIIEDASLVVLYDNNNNPVMVAGKYGPEGVIRASHALDNDFSATLYALGVNRTVICQELKLPGPPPGARLVQKPIWTPP